MFKDGLVYLIDFGLYQDAPHSDDVPLSKTSVGNLHYLDIRGHRNHWQDMTADLQTIAFLIADLYFKKGLPWNEHRKNFKEGKLSYKEAN
jgi:hypothetical protein